MGDILACTCGHAPIESEIHEPHHGHIVRCPNRQTCPSMVVIGKSQTRAREAWNRIVREVEADKEVSDV